VKEKILAVNPGSTSTKVAVFIGENKIFQRDVTHEASELSGYSLISEQLPYRRDAIRKSLEEQNISLGDCEAFSGRGGGLMSCEGGTYEVNELILSHARSGKYVGNHPAVLGAQIVSEFAERYGGRAFVVNPPDTDEFCDEARITGIKGVYRKSHIHALNQKETALRACKDHGLDYHGSNLIVAHIGGGVSVTAHKLGKMVDSNDIVSGDGPMAPTRSGSLPVKVVVDLCRSGQSKEKLSAMLTKNGGFVDHFGTAEAQEILKMIQGGNAYAKLVYDAFAYQIAKHIAAMSAVMCGKVQLVVLTGGIANDEGLCAQLKERIGFLAPIAIYPGEYEMEALAGGAIRVLRGVEKAKTYPGTPVFSGFGIE
jgi:butyrate kinase